jgi:hypothetical protein
MKRSEERRRRREEKARAAAERLWNPPTSSRSMRRAADRNSVARPKLPPRPDIEPTLSWLALVALLLAVAGLALALPYSYFTWNYWSDPHDVPPTTWRNGLWGIAAFIGVSSLVLAILALRQVGKRRGLSKLALGLAFAGACVWAMPVCAEAGTGL